jgi:cellulose synthase/poly-beta-1,6-N-acetylglucosamine synthase-like glycosyltransferase
MMSRLSLIIVAIVATGVIRQAFVLSAIVRSGRFLHQGQDAGPRCAGSGLTPRFFIVVPVLREAAILREAVVHAQALACGHAATVLVVTTAREAAEAGRHGAAGDTIALARELARHGACAHVHYPDPLGLKGDQLNYAAACCAGMLPEAVPSSQAFLVCYDADSRPPSDSLARFARAIADNNGADVFHQSSRFEFRPPQRPGAGPFRRLRAAACDAGALRANRFVLGFEIPRLLNRSGQVSSMKRALCSGVYAHVTGHGLCIRLSLLDRLPFPARSPLEDMHYSFILGSRGLLMVAVPSLDAAEVPGTVTAQVQQAARWFFGPARFARYLSDPAVRPGWRAGMMAASACGSAAEWIGCAIVPALIFALIAAGSPAIGIVAACYAALCAAQLALTEAWLGTPGRPGARLARTAAFPLAFAVHGAGGILGWVRLLAGEPGAGKTERGPRA